MPGTMVRSLLMLSLVLATGCAAAPLATSSPPASASVPALPAGFPVISGAVAVDEADRDPGLIAEWTIDQMGPQVYDFYVEALPAAGYPLEGEYPGGAGAIIRLRAAEGEIWQLVLTPDPSGTKMQIGLRLDQE